MKNVCHIRSENVSVKKGLDSNKEKRHKDKGKNPVSIKWVLKSKEEAGGLICLKSINVVKGYMQVPGVEFTEPFYPFASDTSTRVLIILTLYYE